MFMHLEAEQINIHTSIIYAEPFSEIIHIHVNDWMHITIHQKMIKYLCIIDNLGKTSLIIKNGERKCMQQK